MCQLNPGLENRMHVKWDLPPDFPNWKSVYTRWRRWVQRKIWARVLAWLAEAHDREAYAVDATYVRVHAHGTRARGGYLAQAVGRSRGGLTSKVHLLTDALGYSVRFVVTGGERNDVTQAPALLPPGTGAQVLCDRGYDADWWRARLLAAGHQPVVPGRRNRLIQPLDDDYAYRSRHLIENAFARLKSSRRMPHATNRPRLPTPPSSLSPASASGSCDFEAVP